MKRHESIVPLSRDHHFGLLCCWKIRQGIRKGVAPERIQNYARYFFNEHLQPHFEEEESLLFRYADDELCKRAIAEHRQIADIIEKNPDDLTGFADRLDTHIRFEERFLFPHLEKTLPEETLAVVGDQLRELHANPKPDNYEDEFWV
ncbi:MAG: hemerythrin domain-containing protein [Chitinophagaceae bacterium]|nr:hemerythrin domain-containing protein [Chitinophagaceae bacterium]MCW5929087.1 hemerythrin domain-containing protein [Chitinophagaceae bacterium]